MKHFALALMLALSLGGALTLGGAPQVRADSGGNSDAAHTCQQGGYASVVGVQGDQVITFANTGQCVSFAAQGGQLVLLSVAQPCLNGGYADYARGDATRFASAAACVAYVGGGGTLVGLPDLQLNTSCHQGTLAHEVVCTFTVTNVGIAPTAGTVTLQGLLTPPPGTSLTDGQIALSVTCASGGSGTARLIIGSGEANNQAFVTTSCADAIQPGQQLQTVVTIGGGTAATGVPLSVSGSVSLDNPFGEITLANNTYSATIPTP